MTQVERLTPLEERDLVIAAEGGDPVARRKLVDAFLPSIGGIARHFPTGRVERQDLMQEGVAGLLFAAKRFDPKLGTPFWAYASFWVRKSMQELVADLARPVSLSDRAARDLAHVKTARSEYVQAHGAEPTTAELTTATGFTRTQVDHLLATELAADGADEPLTAMADPSSEREYEEVLDRLEFEEVEELADHLDARERDVLRAHYGIGRPAQTLGEIGGSLGLTAERARQIEAHALQTLREALSTPALA